MGREEGLAVLLEVALILVEHAIQPGKELLSTVIGVEHDGDAVGGGDAADVVGRGDGAVDGGELVGVGDTLETLAIEHNAKLERNEPFQQSKRHHPGRPGG